MISEAIAIGVDARDEPSVAQARVYLAIVLRAAGDLDGSLVEAEQAFESLAASDYMSFSRLATLEVAASLLALGDLSAARSWAEGVVERGFAGNRYHALRAAMILAEIERREGHEAEALAQLSAQADYVLSENANWQIGMYCRAFPALLGLLTKTIGAARLPAHLIRIVLPEYAERALLECHDMLGEAEWRALGTRLLGDSEFEKLVARNGQPLCRVRLFGGLEVSIGGRAIQERDWKKRKVRLLFIMLVSRRGHDVPRDQICERLWPEMDEKQATSNFYVTWSLMKSALGAGADKNKPSPYVESVGGLCRIARAVVSSDIDEFEENLKRAREAEASGDTEAALRCYQRIADIYRGHLLPGDCYDDWFADLRAYYRTEFVDAMLGASGILAASGDRSNALVYLRRAIQADPHREDLYQRAMRSQIDAGMRSAAIETYFQCRERISDELGLDPSIETQGLYREILAMESRPISLAEDIPLC
ncbi:MAG: BTAD domain-containing putative transcriptional regulator [Coriobacteriia bacterium]